MLLEMELQCDNEKILAFIEAGEQQQQASPLRGVCRRSLSSLAGGVSRLPFARIHLQPALPVWW